MPTDRERSCSEKELQAVRFNHNEQRCLEKKINGLKQEGACSINLINQTHNNIKVSYKHLKDKVSKIKTNLTVKEIDEYRKMEDQGKIDIFKNVAKPDSEGRISAYAKRLNIDYENNQGGTSKYNDDVIADEELTRKDKLLRQISDMNERFNAAKEKEREMERRNILFNRKSLKTKKIRNKTDTDYETDVSMESENRFGNSPVEGQGRANSLGLRGENIMRPVTAFEFCSKKSVNEVHRSASSLGNSKTTLSLTPRDTASKIKRSKSVKAYSTKETEHTKEFKPFLNNQALRSKEIKRTKDVQQKRCQKEHTDSSSRRESEVHNEPTFKTSIDINDESRDVSQSKNCLMSLNGEKDTTKDKVGRTNNTKESYTKTINLKHSQSVRSVDKDSKDATIKRRHTSKIGAPNSANVGSVNNTPRRKYASSSETVRPATSVGVNKGDKNHVLNKRALSALSAKGSENVTRIIANMNGPQKAPFDCHAAAEKQEKEANSPKNNLEDTRTKFLAHDSIESNLGHDLHEELRKELLHEEEINAIKIEDKICSFMDKIGDKLRSEKEEELCGRLRVITTEELLSKNADIPKQPRVNVRRKHKFYEDQKRRLEQLEFRRSSESWKDVNKCRYLRIEESKIDLSGIKTLASEQMSLLHGLKFRYEATI